MTRLMTIFAMLVLVVMTGRAGTPQAASRNSHDLGVYDGAASGGEWRTERADAAGGGAMILHSTYLVYVEQFVNPVQR